LQEIFNIMNAWYAHELVEHRLNALSQELDCVESGIFYFTF
jgi:hypothetical protein